MPQLRKRHLRKKRLFLLNHQIFAVFNNNNLKTQEINELKMSLSKAKLYYLPSYLIPPKIAKGYPLLILISDTEKNLQKNTYKISSKLDCIGISINKKWYPTNYFKKSNNNSLDKIFALLLILKTKLHS